MSPVRLRRRTVSGMSKASAPRDLRVVGVAPVSVRHGSRPDTYTVPLILSRVPSAEERRLFAAEWGDARFSLMGRPQARLRGDHLLLRQTTIEDVAADADREMQEFRKLQSKPEHTDGSPK